MPRRKIVTKRPSYREAVACIAHEDNAVGGDPIEWTSGHLTTHLVADLFRVERSESVARDVARGSGCRWRPMTAQILLFPGTRRDVPECVAPDMVSAPVKPSLARVKATALF